jgi:hypothetical protein
MCGPQGQKNVITMKIFSTHMNHYWATVCGCPFLGRPSRHPEETRKTLLDGPQGSLRHERNKGTVVIQRSAILTCAHGRDGMHFNTREYAKSAYDVDVEEVK